MSDDQIPDYMKENFSTEFKPCPQCGSKYVEWSNCRDLNILNSFVECLSCGLRTFSVETMCFIQLPNLDYETTLLKYNAWVDTKPKSYCEDNWE